MEEFLRALLVVAVAAISSVFCTPVPAVAQTDQALQGMLKELGISQKEFSQMAENLGLDWCFFGTTTYDWRQPIDACTNAIKSGKFTGNTLATLFYQRAGSYYSKHDYQHAINDYDEAIRLFPGYALALYERGFAKRAIGDNAGGSADITQAAGLLPEIGRLPAANLSCPVTGGPFVLTDRDFAILAKDGMTKERFSLLPPTSKARKTVCETRKVARVVSGKPGDCALDPYKYWVVQYLDSAEADKLLKVQISETAAMMASGRVKCK